MKKLVSYFDSEWSVAQFRIPDGKAVCAFGPEDQNYIVGNQYILYILLVVSNEGNYYLAEFDPVNGGECKKTMERRLLMGFD